MLLILFAATSVAASEPAPLKLVCRGTLNDTEQERGTVSRRNPDGTYTTGTVVTNREVTRQGELRFELRGTSGTILYDDGTKREFKDAEVSPTKIVASYSRLFGLSKPRIEIDRVAGEARVIVMGSDFFRGSCEVPPERTGPKF
jgi:hypothetical protein